MPAGRSLTDLKGISVNNDVAGAGYTFILLPAILLSAAPFWFHILFLFALLFDTYAGIGLHLAMEANETSSLNYVLKTQFHCSFLFDLLRPLHHLAISLMFMIYLGFLSQIVRTLFEHKGNKSTEPIDEKRNFVRYDKFGGR